MVFLFSPSPPRGPRFFSTRYPTPGLTRTHVLLAARTRAHRSSLRPRQLKVLASSRCPPTLAVGVASGGDVPLIGGAAFLGNSWSAESRRVTSDHD